MAYPALKKSPSVQNPPLTQAYQDSAMTHNQQIAVYYLKKKHCRTTLLIYNTEIETKQNKIIETPELLDCYSCLTQFPSGKLFCYGNSSYSGITLIIDETGEVQVLPSGSPCGLSSTIYFNNIVYCFGGYYEVNWLTLSRKFDLNRNEWAELAPLPTADSVCSSVIFKGNILISGYENINLVRYSIDNNSFTIIPYQFAEFKSKILINGERLYLIECYEGSIYESEIGSDTAWRRIAKSAIESNSSQIYVSYSKGEVYIGYNNWNALHCFRFNLANKSLIKLPRIV